MSDSDSDDAPCLVTATGAAGARSGMTAYEIQQAEAALVAAGGGKPGVDWKVPVSIVTGFLGSGKSTLVQYILTVQKEKKIAVMVNEFGDSNDIERAMRVAADGEEEEDWIEMSNGCMCCKFKDQAVEALENLVRRKGRFDHIVIETSGLADPEPLIRMFWQDLAVESPLSLNGVLTLVDAKHILGHLANPSKGGLMHLRDEPEADDDAMGEAPPPPAETAEDGGFIEATQQISLADSIIVNKTDLVTPQRLEDVTQVVRRLNPDALLQFCSFSKVLDVGKLLTLEHKMIEASALAAPEASETVVAAPTAPACAGDACDHAKCGGASSGKHSTSVGSVTVESTAPLPTRDHLDHLMKRYLWDTYEAGEEAAPVVLRLKAIVHFASDERPVMVQAVGQLYDVTELDAPPLPHTRFVLVGRNLNGAPWKATHDEVLALKL